MKVYIGPYVIVPQQRVKQSAIVSSVCPTHGKGNRKYMFCGLCGAPYEKKTIDRARFISLRESSPPDVVEFLDSECNIGCDNDQKIDIILPADLVATGLSECLFEGHLTHYQTSYVEIDPVWLDKFISTTGISDYKVHFGWVNLNDMSSRYEY